MIAQIMMLILLISLSSSPNRREIKSLTKVLFEEEKNAKSNDADSNVNTSDQFGGKASKCAKKD